MSIPTNSYKSQSTIARFDPIEDSWTKLGNLKVARRGHGVIRVDNEFIVVGGNQDGDKNEATESCKLNGQSMMCTKREPELSQFAYPHLIFMTWFLFENSKLYKAVFEKT